MGANVFHISMDYGELISYRISFIIILLLVFYIDICLENMALSHRITRFT